MIFESIIALNNKINASHQRFANLMSVSNPDLSRSGDKFQSAVKKAAGIGMSIPLKIASRCDLVADYLGKTRSKTRKLLEENRGTALFIQEAGSLYFGDSDRFGHEALDELSQFMTEYPDEIIIVEGTPEDRGFQKYENLKTQCIYVPKIG